MVIGRQRVGIIIYRNNIIFFWQFKWTICICDIYLLRCVTCIYTFYVLGRCRMPENSCQVFSWSGHEPELFLIQNHPLIEVKTVFLYLLIASGSHLNLMYQHINALKTFGYPNVNLVMIASTNNKSSTNIISYRLFLQETQYTRLMCIQMGVDLLQQAKVSKGH